jgi:hypothetical protein|tara:strand:- start:775 stop:924 length:150 start_codon:yes stop_codon:yes gene_type:complete
MQTVRPVAAVTVAAFAGKALWMPELKIPRIINECQEKSPIDDRNFVAIT